jgi:hypothetical protein
MSAALIKALANIESAVINMKAALGVEGAVPVKTKKAKDPSAEPKAPNVWIQFTQRVGPLIKEALGKAPATVGKQFCSFLKEQKAYDQWTDEEIIAAFADWERPEQSKMAAKKAETASESGSVVKERKKREPMTEEAKALRKEKMAAKKAAGSSASSAEEASEAEAKPEEAPAVAVAVAVAAPAAAPAAAAPKKVVAKKTVTKTYTIEQLTDFEEFGYDGQSYGRNIRGDVVNAEGEFAGHWDGVKALRNEPALVKADPPADWETIAAAM